MTWLIVEDDLDILNVVAVMCQVWGVPTLLFSDGYQVEAWLDKVDSGEYKGVLPQFALLDIRMPGKQGHEIARRIRRTRGLKNIAIMLMTAFSLSEKEKKKIMKVSGADRLIHKPLPDMDEFYKIIREVIASRGGML